MKQPEALRLADALRDGTYLLMLERNATEAELRRLHEANQSMLAALKAIEPFIPTSSAREGGAVRHSANVIAADIVRAAIAKGEQS